jgi:hypothetical protein
MESDCKMRISATIVNLCYPVAAKAAVEYGVRKRIEHQLREMKLTELIGLSRQLEN